MSLDLADWREESILRHRRCKNLFTCNFRLASYSIFMCFYNFKGTGKPLLRLIKSTSKLIEHATLFLQKLRSPHNYSDPVLLGLDEWSRRLWLADRFAFLKTHCETRLFFLVARILRISIYLPCYYWGPTNALLLIQFAVSFVGFLSVVWCEPHYAAPVMGVMYALLIQEMRHLRQWTRKGRELGSVSRELSCLFLESCVWLTLWLLREIRTQAPL